MNGHLGSRISALVDGQLTPEAAERALAHVAACPQCADELRSARSARDALLGASHDLPPAPDLTARLLALRGDGPPPPPQRDPFAAPGGTGHVVLRGDVTGRRATARLVAAGSAAGLGVAALALFVLGARPAVTPSPHPAVALGVLAQADDTGAAAAAETLDALRADGWTFPARLPDGWSVLAVRTDEDGVEVDVAGPTGTLVVTEQQGRLDTSTLAGVTVREVGGRAVVVLSEHPWHVAWQATSTVVQVVAADGDDDVATVVAAFPAGPYDDGVTGRIGRGWQTVTAALDRP